jgi:hypothetical protein
LRSSSTLIGNLAYFNSHILTLGRFSHFGAKLEKFFKAFGVVFEAATDVEACEDFVVVIVGFADEGKLGVYAIAKPFLRKRICYALPSQFKKQTEIQ